MSTDIREYLKNNILLFDGAMGTYLAMKDRAFRDSPETANIEKPELVREVHQEYIDSGAMAITTNTFGANGQNYPDTWKQLVDSGFRLAEEAARQNSNKEIYVFADIGPLDFSESDKPGKQYIEIAKRFLDLGARNFIFETQSMSDGLLEAAEFIRSFDKEAFIITSFAVLPDGFTREGIFASQLAKTIGSSPYIDAFGLNCAQGAGHMAEQAQKLEIKDKILALMPNAGYPTVLGHRVFYEGDPLFFAQSVVDMATTGARILGGCCGTTPLHIRKISELLPKTSTKAERQATRTAIQIDTVISPFWNSLNDRSKRTIAVELDPPENASLERFMENARRLKEAEVDAITIADCPIGRARVDSSLLSCKIRRELDMDVLPHLTCRDRNINATKALLLGLYAEEVRNVLLVTGDPVPSARRDEVKSVYQFNSRKLAAFVNELGKETLPGGFHIFGALNVNARNFDIQLKLAKEKEKNGITGFLTQPVLTEEAVGNLRRAREELNSKILGGLIPIVSERNARYMESEVNGINIDEQIIKAYEGKDRSEAEDLAVEITTRFASEIKDCIDGFYLVTPFSRIALMERIIANLRTL